MNYPDFKYEKVRWRRGFKYVAGVDEVGKGCFAGPVVAAVAAFAPNSNYQFPISGEFSKRTIVNDSKQLTPRQREIADKWIRKNALVFGIGQASVTQINKLGIKKATEIAFRRAIKACGKSIDYLLIDAFFIPYVKGLRRKRQQAIIKGDTKSISIAAASIIAKVYRDKLMTKLSKQPKYRKYGWGRNKGYGTREHRNAIKKYGTTRQHRKAFVNTWLSKLEAQNPKSENAA
jgi:ribonuclease HII